jgi:hypothetical protein
MTYSKKSQVKFGETFGVMIIMYFVIIFGMYWYDSYLQDVKEDLFKKNKKLIEKERIEYISNLKYLKYSFSGIIGEEFDLYSLYAYSKYSKNETYKKEIRKNLGTSLVVLKVLNESLQINQTIILYNNSLDNPTDISIFRLMYPIKNSVLEKTNLGLLEITLFK